jgi:hypothetical protein
MFDAFMPLHILLCDEVPMCIVLRVEVVHRLNLNSDQNCFLFIKDFKNGKLTLSGLRGKGLTRPS